MFYYLIVTYNIHDIELEGESNLVGPFETVEEREKSLEDVFDEEIIQNVTKLKTSCSLCEARGMTDKPTLTRESSEIIDE